MKTIEQLVCELPCLVEVIGDKSTLVNALCADSRKVEKGGLFICISGTKMDSHAFAGDAAAKGAAALVVEHPVDVDLPQIVVTDSRLAMNRIAQAFYDFPARSLKMIGITGTKGKSTTCFLIKSILESAGYKVGLIGTITTMIGDVHIESKLTTPDPIELQALLRRMVDEGVNVVTMEVSAHALALRKLDGIHYDVVAFTNFSHDHLDFFGTMDNYFEAKMRLLTPEFASYAVFDADDARLSEIGSRLKIPYESYAISKNANIYARNIDLGTSGLTFALHYHKHWNCQINLKLAGLFNVYNALCASAVCSAMGIGDSEIRKGLERTKCVPGRMEVLETGTPYQVILDYAHSPDSLENVLNSVQEFAKGDVIALFGCGGNRDTEKRPIMGEIGVTLADYCIITSDNPRYEEPMDIIRAICEGADRVHKKYEVIENRRDAIRRALEIAKPDDVIVLAGKGHETYQEIKGVKYDFDEKVVVRELLDEMKRA